jgi:endonuclease/exonuclease/phosphatase (EEP) superfamily protein YafD
MDTPTPTPKKRTWRDVAFTWLMLALVPTALATLIGFAASVNPLAELFVHFKVLYWWSGLLTGVGLCALKRWRWAMVALVVFVIHSVGIVPWYVPRSVDVPDGVASNLRLLSANVLSTNQSPEEVIAYIREANPDIVLLQEISPSWVSHLQPLVDSAYPHAKFEPQTDNFGMATLSKIPIDSFTVLDPLNWAIPIIESKLTINGRSLSILNFHPLPPGNRAYIEVRNQQLAYVDSYTKAQADLCIVAGDFNVTPWSPQYTSMVNDSCLYNTRQGFGLLLSWPKPPVIPIDHVLASTEIHTLDMHVGPNVGSDHRPLLVHLYIPAKP